eukprot:CAMPEP_0181337982 /NCGR_PEP_ID=MMETSP1101-20121128/28365_1 /TAXON_ID=46948 /ORGANISM="Rhodomonas abbreviata, Strain Caron Lab Isolate" /LENGTH=141 /DNA_ID=CAMNT_0023448625 /DNA_START=36 /DNA_END=457 /DNA_ORIENTATION=-
MTDLRMGGQGKRELWEMKARDLKPLIGALWGEELRAYELWGYLDSSLLLGNLSGTLGAFPLTSLLSYDVIHPWAGHAVWAPLSLFHRRRASRLALHSPQLCWRLSQPSYQSFDTHGFSAILAKLQASGRVRVLAGGEGSSG